MDSASDTSLDNVHVLDKESPHVVSETENQTVDRLGSIAGASKDSVLDSDADIQPVNFTDSVTVAILDPTPKLDTDSQEMDSVSAASLNPVPLNVTILIFENLSDDVQERADNDKLEIGDSDYYEAEESQLFGTFNTSAGLQLCTQGRGPADSSWQPCLLTGGQLGSLEAGPNLSAPRSFPVLSTHYLPPNTFLSSEGAYLSLVDQPVHATTPSTPPFTPRTMGVTPSWRFPFMENTGLRTQSPTSGITQSDSSAGSFFQKLTNPLLIHRADQSAITTTNPITAGSEGGSSHKISVNSVHNLKGVVEADLAAATTTSRSSKAAGANSASSPDILSPRSDNDFLAMTKEELIAQIKLKENQLRKQQLMHQIRLKESELQKLLAVGVSGQESSVPSSGRWKIQSQRLGGQPVPDGEWILPGQEDSVVRHGTHPKILY
jgi:hypothetical protein